MLCIFVFKTYYSNVVSSNTVNFGQCFTDPARRTKRLLSQTLSTYDSSGDEARIIKGCDEVNFREYYCTITYKQTIFT